MNGILTTMHTMMMTTTKKTTTSRRILLVVVSLSLLCPSSAFQLPFQPDHHLDQAEQSALPSPSGPLPWADLNILSTTDTHGWLRGHLHAARDPESLYSADIGDLANFKLHLTAEADRRGVDLLFVDSGDQLDGNGFVDADTSGYKGHAARELLAKVGWDLTTPGNHEVTI